MTYEMTKKEWSMPYSHHHSHYEIYILLSGERTVEIGENVYQVKSGFATLFEGNISHRSTGNTDYTGICIHFSKAYLDTYFKSNVVSFYLSCFRNPFFFVPEAYCQRLLDWTEKGSWRGSDGYLLLAQILSDLNRFPKKYSEEETNEVLIKKNKYQGVSEIIEYIENSYTVIQTVSDIAKACGVSESYIHRIVKKHTSLTVKYYINNLRLRHAMHEIECTNKSFASIAKDCGFQNVCYFYRLFRQLYGVTPSQYKKENEKN